VERRDWKIARPADVMTRINEAQKKIQSGALKLKRNGKWMNRHASAGASYKTSTAVTLPGFVRRVPASRPI
jgi:hypothetical protein